MPQTTPQTLQQPFNMATQPGAMNTFDVQTKSMMQPSMVPQLPQTAFPQTAFKINVPKTVPSSVLTAPTTASNVMKARDTYQQAQSYTPATDPSKNFATAMAAAPAGTPVAAPAAPANPYEQYAKQLATNSQYSPEYLAALQSVQQAKLGEQQINTDLLSGAIPGDTQGYTNGLAQRALGYNALQQTAATNALAVQQTIRQGNIDASKALVDAYSPQSVSPGSSLVSPANGSTVYGGSGAYSDYQAQQTYFNLAQSFPDAQIPSYDPTLTPQQNLQRAQQLAASAPSFQSKNLMQVTDAAGGIHFVNKNQLQTNPDGSYTYISGAQAATMGANKTAIADMTKQRADVSRAITTAESNFPLLISAAQKAGVNQNAPLFNQMQQAVAKKLVNSEALASLNTLIPSLQAEYAQIVSRGGSVTNETRANAEAIVNGTYSLKQLKAVYNTLQAESQNVLKGYDDEINRLGSQLDGGQSSNDPWASLLN